MPTHCFRNRDMVWHAFKKLMLMVRLGNRTISVNLVRNVSASDTPFASPRLW